MRTVLILLALAPVAASAQMYKCLDARGATVYSDKPCPAGRGGAVNIRSDPPAEAAKGAGDYKRQEIEFRKRQSERAEAEAQEKAERDKLAAEKREYCDGLKKDLLTLESRSRIVLDVNSKGERTYMDDATRAKTLAETKANLRSHCE